MERKLLLLGLLQMQEMHGYQLNEMIDAHLSTSIDFKKPTIYKLLGQMRDVGWLEQREEEAGNRPPRRVYTITPAGRDAFKALLRESLAAYKPTDFIDHISLAFLDHLSPAETVPLLENRKAQIQALLHRVQSYDPHQGSMQLMVEHQIRHLEMEITWLEEVIERVVTKGIGMPGGTHHDRNE